MSIVNALSISVIIVALANIPLTLESGISFPIGNWSPAVATRFLMKNSPFLISATSNGGIQLTNSKGQSLLRTSPIIEAKAFDNGYCYFVTESGHKYHFTTFEKVCLSISNVQQRWMEKPVVPIVKQYTSFGDLPLKEKIYFKEYMEHYISYSQSENERYVIGKLKANRADFGFVDGIFCHISDSKERLQSLINYNGKNVVGRVVETPRGYKLCDYIFERDYNDYDDYDDYDESDESYEPYEPEPDAYLETVIALKAAAQRYYLKEVNDRLKEDAEWHYKRDMSQYEKQMEIQSILGFHAINIKHEYDNRAYCDSKSNDIFEFSRPISREEFSSFLKEMGKEEKAEEAWYTPYTIVKGNGDKWIYTCVRPSTH